MASRKKRSKNHIKKGKNNNKDINSTTRQTTGNVASPQINVTATGTAGKTPSSTIGAITSKKTSSKTGAKPSPKTSKTTDETTSSQTGETTGAETGETTSSETGETSNDTEASTISSILEALSIEELAKIRAILGIIGDLNVANLSLLGLAVNETDRVYYDNRLKPLIDAIFNLGLASANIATSADLYQRNAYTEKHEIKKALDITYEINDSIEIVVCILKNRLKYYEHNTDCCK